MKDYYKELEIDRNLTTDEINKKLVELNVIWTKRSNINQEKAMPKLLLIYEAQDIFKTDASRREYDRSLSIEDMPIKEKPHDTSYLKDPEIDKSKKNSQPSHNDESELLGCFATICIWALGLGMVITLASGIGGESAVKTWVIGYTIVFALLFSGKNNKDDNN